MNCSEVDELIGAYALDALDETEAADVREHLRTCARHAAMADELRRTSRRLAAGAEPMAPPMALRTRVLAAVDAVAQETESAPVAMGRRRRFGDRYPRWLWGAGAAAAVVIIGLLVWNITLQRGGSDLSNVGTRARVVAVLEPQGAPGGGAVLYFPDEHKVLVVGDGLKALDRASTYQLWEIDGGQPRSIGLMEADASGHATAAVPYQGGAGHTFAITIEPAGGSPQPTSNPIYVAKL